MTALDDRLRSLGDVLDLDDSPMADLVLARLDEHPAPAATTQWLRVAAVVVIATAVAVAAVPSSRHAVADWFGFDGARIERRPDVSAPSEPDPLDRGRPIGTVVDVGATEVLVSEFTGTLDNPALTKIATAGTRVQEVTVNGEFALWIDGEPHEVSLFDERGEIVFEGFAGNTLLWQDGPLIRRLEGFDDVDDAIEYAESIGT